MRMPWLALNAGKTSSVNPSTARAYPLVVAYLAICAVLYLRCLAHDWERLFLWADSCDHESCHRGIISRVNIRFLFWFVASILAARYIVDGPHNFIYMLCRRVIADNAD